MGEAVDLTVSRIGGAITARVFDVAGLVVWLAPNIMQLKEPAMKSYRSRKLGQKCQIAKTADGITPLKDDKGQVQVDHGGLYFLKVSGGDNHDNKRLIPEDHDAFFKFKARELEEALKAEGIADASVTAEEMYAEFVNTFTKPNQTFAPAGHPEEFSIVLPKGLCINWVGCPSSAGPGVVRMPNMAPQASSVFARLKAARAATNGQPNAAASPFNRKKNAG